MELPDFLEQRQYGEIGVRGHRIDLYYLIYFFKQGESARELVARFPTLSITLVEEILAYYQTNQKEIDAYVAACQAEMDRNYAMTPKAPTLEELRERLRLRQPKTVP